KVDAVPAACRVVEEVVQRILNTDVGQPVEGLPWPVAPEPAESLERAAWLLRQNAGHLPRGAGLPHTHALFKDCWTGDLLPAPAAAGTQKAASNPTSPPAAAHTCRAATKRATPRTTKTGKKKAHGWCRRPSRWKRPKTPWAPSVPPTATKKPPAKNLRMPYPNYRKRGW